MMTLIDSHAHLDGAEFDPDREAVLERAKLAGVTRFVNPGVTLASSEACVALAERHPEIRAAVGIHPHEAYQVEEATLAALRELAGRPQVVAIGETGLDYHYNFSLPETQRVVLRRQVRLARERRLPLILHCREAFGDLIGILAEEKGEEAGGVVHCFTGEWDAAERFLAMGFHIGITGIVTFRNAVALAEVVKRLPLDRLLVETDAPYLAPHPHRGKRNEPALLVHTVERIAEVRETTPAAIADAATRNTERLFRLASER